MKRKNNFASIVTMGNFNPAILTADFLEKQCSFDLGAEPQGQTTPMMSNLSYGTVSFLVDFGRFQITESDVKTFEESKVADLLGKYLEVLCHTPLSVCGVNFNVTASDIDRRTLEKCFVTDREGLKEFLGAEEMILDSKLRYKSEDENEYLMWNVSSAAEKPNVVEGLNVRKEKDGFTLNYNYEVGHLGGDGKRIALITEEYLEIVSRFESLFDKLTKVQEER